MTAPDLSAAEAAIVASFDAAPPLPELDEGRVEELAYELASDLACARWYDLTADQQQKWRDVARHALSVPGVAL